MKIEIILLGVIGLVILIDFFLKGIKRKDNSANSNEISVDPIEKVNKTSKINWITSFLMYLVLGFLIGFVIDFYFNSQSLFYIISHFDIKNQHLFYIDTIYKNTIYKNLFIGQIISFVLMFFTKNEFIKYILLRKKNIVLSIIIIHIVKILIHYLLYPIKYRNRGEDALIVKHIESVFTKEIWLFIPSILIILFISWYFNDKIKAR